VIVVELRRRRPDTGEVEVLARISVPVPGGPALVEAVGDTDPLTVEILLGDGVPDASGAPLLPSAGEAYALALPGAFRGSRLWAERVS
jgi:hypothetical protein